MRKAFTLMFPVLLLTVLTVGLVFPALATKGSYPGTNGKIAFDEIDPNPDPPYDSEIFVMDNDGTNIEQLTHNDVPDRNPCWSPDGSKIAFQKDSPSKIWVIDADGSNPRQLTTPPNGYRDADPAWSPDGSKIAYTRFGSGSDRAVFVIDADGPAGPGTLLIQNGQGPSWSPDGSEISYDSFQGIIYVADASTGTLKRTLGSGNDSCWSPDGSKIVFVYNAEIWVMDAADGSNRQQLSNPPQEPDYDDDDPNWSPDGTKIVFDREEDSIWIMDADGTNEYDLTPTRPNAMDPDYQRLDYQPVGGVASPVNKLELIAPYLALAGLIVAVSTIFVIKRRRD